MKNLKQPEPKPPKAPKLLDAKADIVDGALRLTVLVDNGNSNERVLLRQGHGAADQAWAWHWALGLEVPLVDTVAEALGARIGDVRIVPAVEVNQMVAALRLEGIQEDAPRFDLRDASGLAQS